MTILSGARVHQIIPSNHFRVWVGKNREGVARLLGQVARHFGSIDTDRNRSNAYCFELVQTLLNTPQLGVAGRSPVASVKNKQHTFWRVAIYR